MSRNFHPLTISVLGFLSEKKQSSFQELYRQLAKETAYKEFYNLLYRLQENGLIEKTETAGKLLAEITTEGEQSLKRLRPKKDGIWKLVIFDIPEKHKYVRVVLRAKLKSLGFKKWQNSIWVSPFALDEEIEQELNQLGKKYFIRLIKTTDINNAEDLEKLF